MSESLDIADSNAKVEESGVDSRVEDTQSIESLPDASNIIDRNTISTNVNNNVNKLLNLVGNTPLLPFQRLLEPHKCTCQVFAKCEFKNPSGSSWDRLILNKIHEMHQLGELTLGTYFVTGGNANICKSLAWAGATANLCVSVLPNASIDETELLLIKGFGANVILSYRQDPFTEPTQKCMEAHIDSLQLTSRIFHHNVLPFVSDDSIKVYQELMDSEILFQLNTLKADTNANSSLDSGGPMFDLIVCSDDNKNLLYGLAHCFLQNGRKRPIIVGVNLKGNSFSDEAEINDTIDTKYQESVKWFSVSDAEAFDMTRRVLREEGLMAGPISGAVLAAAVKAVSHYGLENNPDAKVLVILPDSLGQTSSIDFLATDWMVGKGYYDSGMLESLLWWYDMALENVNSPLVMTVPPDAPIDVVCKAMGRSLAQRAVVVGQIEESKPRSIVGVVTYENLIDRVESPNAHPEQLIKDVCYKRFGIIDSKKTLTDLERLLRRYHWVVKLNRMTIYGSESEQESSQTVEDVVGVINFADFMRYKQLIEAHHLNEYGIKMSDGIPTETWVEKFGQISAEEKINGTTSEPLVEDQINPIPEKSEETESSASAQT